MTHRLPGCALLLAALLALTGCPKDPPIAAFRAAPNAGEAPLTVQFTDLSLPGARGIDGWRWAFGDGTESRERNPVHVYAAEGNYDVRLTVSAGRAESTFAIDNAVRVGVEFKVTFVNDSAFPAAELYIADAGAPSAGPNRLSTPVAPGARRDLSPTFHKGQHIVAAVARDGDTRYTVYVAGNMDTVELVGERMTLLLEGDAPGALALTPIPGAI